MTYLRIEILKKYNSSEKVLLFQKYWYLRFGLMYVLVQPSYSDKIYDLTFLKKANSINSGSGLTLTTALSTTVPHRWTMDSFKFQHQDDSLSLPATFIIFFF